VISHLYDRYVDAPTPDDDEVFHQLEQTLTNNDITSVSPLGGVPLGGHATKKYPGAQCPLKCNVKGKMD